MDLQRYEAMKQRVVDMVRQWQRQHPEIDTPTVRQLARKFRITQEALLTLVEDTEELDYNIGIMIRGAGVGYYVYDNIGDYTVEAIDDPPKVYEDLWP
jgi:hypothetical protein